MNENHQHFEYFVFGGLKSTDYGVWISGESTFNAPERDVDVIEIPGRNGTLTMDNGRWKNVQITYPCFFSGNFKEDFDTFKNAILPKYGYLKLEDTYHPTGYRMARLMGGIKPKTGPYNRSAQFELTFDCWPQFYLNAGTIFPGQIEMYSGGTIDNVPLASYSQPLVRVYFDNPFTYGNKSGSVTFGDRTITFTDVPYTNSNERFFVIDSEAKTITKSISGVTTDISSYCDAPDGFFEILPPSTQVSSTGVLTMQIVPRWWSL